MKPSLTDRIAYRLYQTFGQPKLAASPGAREQARIDWLRAETARIELPKEGQQTSRWLNNQKVLIEQIRESDPRYFLSWDVIINTMFSPAPPEEFAALKAHPQWQQLSRALREDAVGQPKRYYLYPYSSGNLMHHAYSLLQLQQHLGAHSIVPAGPVLEFGGGYGSLARYLFRLGYAADYMIYDLPLFNKLQQFYLSSVFDSEIKTDSVSHPNGGQVIMVNHENTSKYQEHLGQANCFIALWSLSESPLAVRQTVLGLMGEPQYFLIAYQNQFEDIDNKAYFLELQGRYPNYTWHNYAIGHLPGHNYLIGIKKSEA